MSFNVSKYFVMGTINCGGKNPLDVLQQALEAGVTMFQLREKGEGALQGEAYEQFAADCQQLCRQYNVPFLVNDDIELALALEADGVHIGQDDQSLEKVRALFPQKIVGVSVHTAEEMAEAVAGGANYVGIGAIFPTNSKDNAAQLSLAFLQQMRLHYPRFPIVGIGGITSDNSALVRAAGADGVAVISAVTLSADIKATVARL